MRIDSFSGACADLKGADRTTDKVLEALHRNPRISVWDMSELAWLRQAIDTLKRQGLIEEVNAPYPWLSFLISPIERTD